MSTHRRASRGDRRPRRSALSPNPCRGCIGRSPTTVVKRSVRVRCGMQPLVLPKDEPAAGEVHRHVAVGPADARVLIAERRIRLDINGRETPRDGRGRGRCRACRSGDNRFCHRSRDRAWPARYRACSGDRRSRSAWAFVHSTCCAAASPNIRAGRELRLAAGVPDEVRPLVDEVNALLDCPRRGSRTLPSPRGRSRPWLEDPACRTRGGCRPAAQRGPSRKSPMALTR